MRWIWVLVWLVLLVSQLILAGMLKNGRERAPVPVPAESVDLLELARATDEAWDEIRKDLFVVENPLPEEDGSDVKSPIYRERLLLRIRDVENRLIRDSVDAELSDPLRDWLAMGGLSKSAQTGSNHQVQYLGGLLSVLEAFSSAETGIAIRRLRLHPDGRSAFPGLYLEASGGPVEMGSLLFSEVGGAPSWNLVDLELTGPPVLDAWWLKGTCAYQPEMQP